MFVRLLVLLISNVFVSFSGLVCCRSLHSNYSLKGGIEQRTNMVPVSVLEHKGAAIKRTYDRARRDKIEHKIRDRAYVTSATYLVLP